MFGYLFEIEKFDLNENCLKIWFENWIVWKIDWNLIWLKTISLWENRLWECVTKIGPKIGVCGNV